MAEELSPGRLLPVRCIPNAGATASVIAPVGRGGVGEGPERVPGRALVPEATAKVAPGCGSNIRHQ